MSKELTPDDERWEGIAGGSIIPTQADWDSLEQPKETPETIPDKKSDDQS